MVLQSVAAYHVGGTPPLGIPQSLHKAPHGFHEGNESLVVFMPSLVEFLLRREAIAAHLHRHLKTVGVQVVEVLHAWRRVGREKDRQ